MKNLFDEATKAEILKRIDQLGPEAKAQWGKMNVNQSLRHMAMALEIPTGAIDPTPAAPVTMPKWLLKFFLLNMAPPKAKVETFLEINTVTRKIIPPDFEAEKKNLKLQIEKFITAKTLAPENKLVGKFSKDHWGKLQFNHIDHHLRQFGA